MLRSGYGAVRLFTFTEPHRTAPYDFKPHRTAQYGNQTQQPAPHRTVRLSKTENYAPHHTVGFCKQKNHTAVRCYTVKILAFALVFSAYLEVWTLFGCVDFSVFLIEIVFRFFAFLDFVFSIFICVGLFYTPEYV